jgi:hypothetical protein
VCNDSKRRHFIQITDSVFLVQSSNVAVSLPQDAKGCFMAVIFIVEGTGFGRLPPHD